MKPDTLPLTSGGAAPLAWGFRFDSAGRATPLDLHDEIGLDCPDGGFVWCHLDLVDNRARDWVASIDALPQAAKRLLAEAQTHPQLDHGNGFVWGTIVDLTREFDKIGDEAAHLRFVVGETFMITGRRQHLQAIEALRQAIDQGVIIGSPIDLLEQVMERVVDSHTAQVENISGILDEIEDRVLDDAVHDERKRLGPLRRKVARIHRQLGGMRTIFTRLELAHAANALSPGLRILVVRLLQRIDSLYHEVCSMQERARLMHEEIGSKIATETNRNLYILTLLATVLMPPTFISGMFGMNTKGLIFADDDNGFLYAVVLCVVSALVVFIPLQWLRRGR